MSRSIGRLVVAKHPSALVGVCLFSWSMLQAAFAATPQDYTVMVSATVQKSPPAITLVWPAVSATSYSIQRKSSASSWTSVGSSSGSATSWTDTAVSVGTRYEYKVVRNGSPTAYGFIVAGIEIPAVESRGKVLLVVERTYAADLAAALTRLQQDLIGDGWTVVRRDVARTDSVAAVKNLIKAESSVRSVFLFGRVPVPYSGNLRPDGHPDHEGAWPADVYYGDLDGYWTDYSVNNTVASRSQNRNVPGDGKFDQSAIPSDVDLELGRVDLANMGSMGSELDLLRRYLDKDHAFRFGQFSNIARRGVVDDDFGEFYGEAFAQNGWRNFGPLFGAQNVSANSLFNAVGSTSYLFAYGCGPGVYTSASGVGSTGSFANTSVQSVFFMLLGSYFGDWDSDNNFLRAPLGSPGYGLTSAWAGRPHWHFHHMGLGEVIGYSARLSQNNSGTYTSGSSPRGVHVALMGDPTLRLHPFAPPSSLSGSATSGVTLTWSPSPASGVTGYYVYRASSASGPFSRISGLVAGTSYVDGAGSGTYTYMVRALKLENSSSGSYYNLSQGVFVTLSGGSGGGSAPSVPAGLVATAGNAQISLSWSAASGAGSYNVKRASASGGPYTTITTSSSTSYVNTGLANGTPCYYVVSASNAYGESGNSAQASATPAGPPATANLPAPWVDKDIGAVGSAGGASYSNGTFTVKGAGADIWDKLDAFNYCYQPLSGDGTIVARVARLDPTDKWAKAGVMIRSALDPSSAHAMVVVSSGNGVAFQRRSSAGSTTSSTSGALASAPYWVKLVRAGSTFSAYQSADGSNWTQIGSASIAISTAAFIGLGVTSHRYGTVCSAGFDNVSVTTGSSGGGGGGITPPPGLLPSPWVNKDLGSVGAAGSATYASAAFTLKGSGADIWGSADAFHFVYQPMSGDGQIVARVASLDYSDMWAKAGVMIRGALTPESSHAMMVVSAGNGSSFQRRVSSGGVSSSAPGTNIKASCWLKLSRVGNSFSAYQSTDGVSWTLVGTVTINMGSSAYIGMAVTSHRYGTLTRTVIDNVTVSAPTGPVEGLSAELSGLYPGDGAATSLRLASAQALNIETLNLGLNWTATREAALRIEASLELPQNFKPEGMPLTIECAGIVTAVVLNGEGRASFEEGYVKLLRLRGGKTAKLLLLRRAGNLERIVSALGLSAESTDTSVQVTVGVTLGLTQYGAVYEGNYRRRNSQASLR